MISRGQAFSFAIIFMNLLNHYYCFLIRNILNFDGEIEKEREGGKKSVSDVMLVIKLNELIKRKFIIKRS